MAGSLCRHFRQIVSRSLGVSTLQLRRRHRLVGHHLHDGVQVRRRLERRPARQQLIEDGAQRVDVAGRPNLLALAAGLLGRHVRRRPHDGARGRLANVVELLGQTEVGDFGRAVLRQQDVGRLQVAVNDAFVVRCLHGAGQRLQQACGLPCRQRGAVELPVQAAAGTELQGEEGPAVVLADLVDLDDVRVLEAGDGLGLGAETCQLRLAGVAAGQDHLEGDDAAQLDVPRLVDDTHATLAELAEDLVAGHLASRATAALETGRRQGGKGIHGRGGRHRLEVLGGRSGKQPFRFPARRGGQRAGRRPARDGVGGPQRVVFRRWHRSPSFEQSGGEGFWPPCDLSGRPEV